MQPHQHGNIRRTVTRVIILWTLEVIALIILERIYSGIIFDKMTTAIQAVIVISFLNALLWPFLSYVLIPFAVFTLGLFTLLLNGFIVYLAQMLIPGVEIRGFFAAVLVAVGMTLITTILSGLLTIDDDGSYYRNVIRRRMKKARKPDLTDIPGVLFLEIDGLAEDILKKAIDGGYMPTLARWLEEGSHRIIGWECDLSSQTSASQAGILHGNNHDIVAFRWYDKKNGKIMASSDSSVLRTLEEQRSDGNGLLSRNGASRGNMFSGDAPSVMYTASTLKDLSRLHAKDFYAFFVNPYNFSRTLILSIWEIILENYQFWKAYMNDVRPRLGRDKRGRLYPLIRAVTTVFLRDLSVYTLIGDMFAGVSSVYTTFIGYDEVAHHSGVESEDAYKVLFNLDKKFARLEMVAQEAPRPYRFIVLSDHGQCNGATFRQRYGHTFEEFVQQLSAGRFTVKGSLGTDEDWGHINAFLTEVIHHQRTTIADPIKKVVRNRIDREGRVVLGPKADTGIRSPVSRPEKDVIVLGSGNLGLIYFPEWKERLTLERIDCDFPGLISGLVGHEGIGFVMVDSEKHGPVVIGTGGTYYMNDDRVEGDDPLADFGPNAAYHLRRTDSFSNVPDILVNSFCLHEKNEVAALEEQIGSHGGLGGLQSRPFILAPSDWKTKQDDLVGAESVYRALKGWLDEEQGSVT